MKKYLFVSDIHGFDEILYHELLDIANGNELPEIVFFIGDVVGTELLDRLQNLFYNRVFNPMRALLKLNPNPTDEEILSYPLANGQDKLTDGCHDLWICLRQIDREYPAVYVPDYVREIAQYEHFGHFCSNLSTKIKDVIKSKLEQNALTWIFLMNRFAERGVRVEVIEGNWDARTPIDFFPTKKYCKPVPIKYRSFYFAHLLKQHANHMVHYHRRAATVKTQNEIFILWPFDCCVAPTSVPKFDENEYRIKVLVSHGQIDWKPIKGDTPMTTEGEKIQKNMGMTICDLDANFGVHGHLHVDKGIEAYYFKGKKIYYLPLRTLRYIEFLIP